MELKIVKYNKNEHFELWDDFVMNKSVNGTIFHTQKFISYHPKDRFDDASTLLYDGNKLAATMLVAKMSDGSYNSHPGTSGGGVVVNKNYYKAEKLNEIINQIYKYFENKLDTRIFESYFGEVNNDLLVYFFNLKTTLFQELSIYLKIPTQNDIDIVLTISDSRTRTSVRKLDKEGYSFCVSNEVEDFKDFHEILSKNLEKHNTKPVHSLDDLLKLREILGDKQFLALGKDATGKIVTALWIIKATKNTWHPQYIARDYETELRCTVEKTIANVMEIGREEGVSIFSLGISTEDMGRYLNLGLVSFKERMGGFHQMRYIAKANG